MALIDARRLVQRFIRRGIGRRKAVGRRLSGASPPTPRLPSTHQDAAQALVEPLAFGSRAYARQAVPDYSGADPVFQDFLSAFLKELAKRKMPLVCVEVLRGRERQNALQKAGVSKARFGQSAHNFGMGADVVHFTRFWNLTPKEWAVVGLIGKEVARKRQVSIVWGGDWSFYDPGHWELADWRIRKGVSLADRVQRFRDDPASAKRLLKPPI